MFYLYTHSVHSTAPHDTWTQTAVHQGMMERSTLVYSSLLDLVSSSLVCLSVAVLVVCALTAVGLPRFFLVFLGRPPFLDTTTWSHT